MKYAIHWRDRQYRIDVDWVQVAADVTGFVVLVAGAAGLIWAVFPMS